MADQQIPNTRHRRRWAAIDWIGSQRPIYIVMLMVIAASALMLAAAALFGSN